jgi:transposase
VIDHYVMEALTRKDRSNVTRIMIDETIARRGHRYVTVVLDADHRG